MTRIPITIPVAIALFSTGCSSLSFPSLPSFSLLEGDSKAGDRAPSGSPPLPSRPDHFRYDDATARTTIRFARGSSLFEKTALPALDPIQEALTLDPQARLLITGFSSRGASPGADRVLGEQRALTIRNAIATTSTDFPSRIHTTSFGSDRPPAGLSTPGDQVDLILFSSSVPSTAIAPQAPVQ